MRTTFRRRLLGALVATAAVTALAMALVASLLIRYHLMSVGQGGPPAGTGDARLLTVLARALLVAGAAGGVLSLVLSRRLAQPLERIRSAAARIAAGDYRQRIAVDGADSEVAALAEDFNRIAAGMEQNEAVRRALVANVAHELRNPLTSVIGYLEAIEDGVFEPRAETLQLLRAETERLRAVLDDFQQSSGPAGGRRR